MTMMGILDHDPVLPLVPILLCPVLPLGAQRSPRYLVNNDTQGSHFQQPDIV